MFEKFAKLCFQEYPLVDESHFKQQQDTRGNSGNFFISINVHHTMWEIARILKFQNQSV